MQGTRVRALVQEDPTCCRATKPVRHNYWACALKPARHNYWARAPQLLRHTHLEPVLRNKKGTAMRSPRTATKSSPCSLQLEKARAQQRRPNAAKKFFKKLFFDSSFKGKIENYLRVGDNTSETSKNKPTYLNAHLTHLIGAKIMKFLSHAEAFTVIETHLLQSLSEYKCWINVASI